MVSEDGVRSRIAYLRKTFERIAYASLGADMAIAAATLLYCTRSRATS